MNKTDQEEEEDKVLKERREKGREVGSRSKGNVKESKSFSLKPLQQSIILFVSHFIKQY